MSTTRRIRRTVSQRSEQILDFHDYGINPDAREIVLMSSSEAEEEGIDYCCASTFIKNLILLNSVNHKPIIVHQCTIGGEWNYGIAIYDTILLSPSPVVLIAHGHARSMSSIIPQAAKRRLLMPNADFLIHFGGNEFSGDARSFVAEGRKADEIDKRMIEIYVSRCSRGSFFRRRKWSKEKIRKYLWEQMNEQREWYIPADEAVDMGFMDGIVGKAPYQTMAKAVEL